MRIFIIFLATFLYSKTITATYEAKYGFFGVIARAKGVLETNGTHYKIFAKVKTEGIAKTFSKNLVQTYKSEGEIKEGLFIPKKYVMHFKNNKKEFFKIYSFDYKNRKIYSKKILNGELKYKKELPFFTNQDILTLYWNLPKLMKKNSQTFYAVGAERHTGRVDVEIRDNLIKANLYNKIFVGDKGIVYLKVNPKNWVTTWGMVKNVMKIGDLEGEIVDLNISN